MKAFLLISLVLLITGPLVAEDSVDRLNSDYETLRTDGLIKMNQRQIVALEKVKDSAMVQKDLPLATKAVAAIEALQIETKKLELEKQARAEAESKLPKNRFYRMTAASEKLGTEKGNKIICKFTRLPLNDFAGDKLKITFSANNLKYSEKPNEVFILNNVSGDELGKVAGVRRGEQKEVILTMPPVASLELASVVRGGDALHLKPFSKNVPEVYLSIEK